MLPKRTKVNKHEVVHYPAMPHADLPPFMVDLAARPAISARALEFTILTAARSGEVRHLEWSDIDGTVRAYKCTTFFDRRIELMQDWSNYLGTAFKRAKLRVVQ